MKDTDTINPDHYKPTTRTSKTVDLASLQVIDIIELFGLNYHLGNVAKYIFRSGKKKEAGYADDEKAIEDCTKALWYLTREITRLKEPSR